MCVQTACQMAKDLPTLCASAPPAGSAALVSTAASRFVHSQPLNEAVIMALALRSSLALRPAVRRGVPAVAVRPSKVVPVVAPARRRSGGLVDKAPSLRLHAPRRSPGLKAQRASSSDRDLLQGGTHKPLHAAMPSAGACTCSDILLSRLFLDCTQMQCAWPPRRAATWTLISC